MAQELRLLVTGARGFVGSAVTRAARARPDTFTLVEFVDPLARAPADLTDPAAVERAIEAAAPDAVIHLAAIAAPRQARSDPAAAWTVNLMGTFHLASAVLRHAPHARFVFAGSSEAYGAAFNQSGQPILETAALNPLSAYGATKAGADLMLRQMAKDGLQSVVFRPFNHTGPGQSDAYVVPAFANQIARIEAGLQQPVVSVGNLDARRDFLDVRDVADAYLQAVTNDAIIPGEAYNLATADPVAIGAILDILVQAARCPIDIHADPARYAPNDVPIASGNPQKTQNTFNWKPHRPLKQTIHDVLNHARTRAQKQP